MELPLPLPQPLSQEAAPGQLPAERAQCTGRGVGTTLGQILILPPRDSLLPRLGCCEA